MRIWVTGLGLVSPLGGDVPTTMAALLSGRRAFGPVTLFDTEGCRSSIAAQIADLDVSEVAPAGAAEGWSRTDAMAVCAAREALAGAGLAGTRLPIDLVLGGTTAGMFETEDLLAQMHRDPEARQPLERMLSHPLSATVDRLQQVVAPFRQARTLCSACSSGANAVLLAATWLRLGKSERVLAGGADGLCRLTYTGFSCLGALSPEACRPFDVARQGLNLGEAAAFLVLETEEVARARGAEPLVELRGWAVGAEAHHITNPEASGRVAAAVMQQALARAGLDPSDVDYVNAHGTATPLNDKMEAAALARSFGDEIRRVAVSSSKGQIGHTLGAAGAVEAVISAVAVARGVLPPNVGLEEIDPECQHLQVVRETDSREVRAAMSNSFGFGGSDAVLVFAQPGRFASPPSPAARRVMVASVGSIGPLGAAGLAGARRYVEPGPAPAAGPVAFDPKGHLDLSRARRIDRAGRLTAAALGLALGDAGVAPDDPRLGRAGAIVSEAFGSVDDCSAFIHRVYEKGAKFASPAVFPNLLPSSPVAHASIYHRLGGPVMSTADLGATSESALLSAAELIAGGETDAMLAGGVEQNSPISEAVLEPLYGWGEGGGARSEGAAVLLLEAAECAARPVAELLRWLGWRGAPPAELATLPPPAELGRVAVFAARNGRALDALLAERGWAEAPRRTAAARAGDHEAAGGFAAAAAVSCLAAGELDAALVVGLAPDRGYALLLRAVGPAS